MGSRGPAPGAKAGTMQLREGVPSPPPWLDEAAQAEYQRIVAERAAAGAPLRQGDYGALCAYAQAYSDMARIAIRLREEGEVIEGANLSPIANPLIRSRSLALQTLRTMAHALSLSTADCARVPAKAVAAKGTGFADV